MPVPLRPDRGCLTFSLRMRAVWRHDVFITRVIRHKNGIDTLYTLRASRGSGNAVLTNEKLPRVASRRREVAVSLQNPFRGVNKGSPLPLTLLPLFPFGFIVCVIYLAPRCASGVPGCRRTRCSFFASV